MYTFDRSIPKEIFFLYFGGRPFKLVNYLSVKSAFEVNKDCKITMYMDVEPTGEWWEKIKPMVNIEWYQPKTEIAGVPIPHPAHQADVARLEILLQKGGIYLDIDVICSKPFSEFIESLDELKFKSVIDSTVIMGEEVLYGKHVGYCSAVILAKPNSSFLKRWLAGFDPKESLWRGFRSTGNDMYYAELSTKYTKMLQFLYPEEIITVDKTKFFYPNYSEEELYEFFTQDTHKYDGGIVYHLWSNSAWEDYLKQETIEEIMSKNTAFTRLARRFL